MFELLIARIMRIYAKPRSIFAIAVLEINANSVFNKKLFVKINKKLNKKRISKLFVNAVNTFSFM